MALDNALRALRLQLQHLRDCVGATRITLVEDRPGDVALVDQRANTLDDLLGWLNEAAVLAEEGERSTAGRGDLHRVRRPLTRCHERVNRVATALGDDLLGYDRLVELLSLARSRGGAWPSWANEFQDGLRQSQRLVFDVSDALLACWREFAERAAAGGVNVRSTSIGQRIVVNDGSRPAADGAD
jgi:hypothetical protein